VASPIVALVLSPVLTGPLLLALAIGCGVLALVAHRREAAVLADLG